MLSSCNAPLVHTLRKHNIAVAGITEARLPGSDLSQVESATIIHSGGQGHTAELLSSYNHPLARLWYRGDLSRRDYYTVMVTYLWLLTRQQKDRQTQTRVEFTYLGSVQSATGRCQRDIVRRIGIASTAMHSMNKVWRHTRLICRQNFACTRLVYYPFCCTVRRHGHFCWKIYGSSRSSTRVLSV